MADTRLKKQLEILETGAAYFTHLQCAICLCSGPDAARYLHGRATQEIKALKVGEGAHSLLLTPQGQTLGKFWIARIESGFLICSDPLSNAEQRADFLGDLLRFKVADDFTVTDLSESHVAVSLIGHSAPSLINTIVGEKTSFSTNTTTTRFPVATSSISGSECIIAQTFAHPYPRYELVLPKDQLHELTLIFAKEKATHTAVLGTGEGYELIRIKSGVPQMGSEVTEKTRAPELKIDSYVSFNKGCYAGQEVVEMSTARGRPNRRLVLLEGSGEQAIPVGTSLSEATEEDSSRSGTITSSGYEPESRKIYALAFITTKTADDVPLYANSNKLLQIAL